MSGGAFGMLIIEDRLTGEGEFKAFVQEWSFECGKGGGGGAHVLSTLAGGEGWGEGTPSWDDHGVFLRGRDFFFR